MSLVLRVLGGAVCSMFFVLAPYCQQVYRWPKAQLPPPAPIVSAPFIVIPQIDTGPVIDGDLSDPCWRNAVTARPFLRVYEGLYASFPTEAKILYDDNNLYVGFDCRKIKPEKHTGKEYAEVLLTPPGTTEFYKAAVSETGDLDTHIWGGIPIPRWQGDLKYAVKSSQTGWTAEFAIPFAAMGISMPHPGDIWKANFGRRATLGFRYNVAWAVTYAWFYEPDFFGTLYFGGKKALSAEFKELSRPHPNRNSLQLTIVNRGIQPEKCSIQITLRRQGPDRTVFSKELTVSPQESIEFPAFYDLSDGGRQVATIRIREMKRNRYLLRQSVPSHMPEIRNPYERAMMILQRFTEPGKEDLFENNEDKKERRRLQLESAHLRPSVMNPTTPRETWESMQDPVELLLARAEKLEWWVGNKETLSNREFAVGTENTLTKLLRNKAFLGPPAYQASISAARGEYEGIQLVLIPRGRDLRNVSLELSSLRGPQGDIIPVKNIQWRWVDFVKTRQPHCPVDYIGWYPDPLLPGTPRTIPGGTVRQPIWLTVHIPHGIHAGDYHGTIHILAENVDPWEMEITVHVYDFALPPKPALQTSLWLHNQKIAQWYGWKKIPKEIRRKEYAFLLAHRINPAPISPPYLTLEDFQFCLDRGLNAIQPGFAAAAEWPMKQRGLVEKYYNFLKKSNLLNLGYIYARDEPPPGLYTSVRKTLDQVGEAFPGLKRVGTVAPPAPPLVGGLDTWVVGPNLFYYKPVAQRVAAGDELWLYLSASVKRPFVNWYIDYSGVENRLITWQCWKYGATGLLYWGINEWLQNTKPWSGNPTIDHAIQKGARWPSVPWNTWSYLNANGEAQLVYPGPDGELWSSVRLEIIRDAIEDYDYFALLAKTCDALDKSRDKVLLNESRALLNIGPPIVYDLTKSTNSPNVLLTRRQEVARQIERNLQAVQ